jgi:hypothetical protein
MAVCIITMQKPGYIPISKKKDGGEDGDVPG